MNVIVLVGVQGSGKTTHKEKKYPSYVSCSADDFFGKPYKFDPKKLPEAHASCLLKFLDIVQGNALGEAEMRVPGVVVDNTNTTIAELAPYCALALAYGHELQIKVMMCDPILAAKRQVHGVPKEKVIQAYERMLEQIKLFPPWWPVEMVVTG